MRYENRRDLTVIELAPETVTAATFTRNAFRAAPVVQSMRGGIDSVASLEQLAEIEPLIPDEWLPAAVGTAEECARYWRSELEHGVAPVAVEGRQR